MNRKLLIPPPLQFVTGILAMWAIDQILPGVRIFLPFQIEFGTLIILVGLIIEIVSVFAFFRARTTINPIEPHKASKLVIGGLYRISRNPMYLGMAMMLTGWMIRLGNPANLGVLILFVVLITVLQIKPEEAVLQEKFADEYEDYCRQVRRWI